MNDFFEKRHKYAARVLTYALTLDDTGSWQSAFVALSGALSEKEMVAIAFFALRSLQESVAVEVSGAAASVAGAGMPIPPLFGVMDEASTWACFATAEELAAYCLACFLAMEPNRQRAFLDYVAGRAAA